MFVAPGEEGSPEVTQHQLELGFSAVQMLQRNHQWEVAPPIGSEAFWGREGQNCRGGGKQGVGNRSKPWMETAADFATVSYVVS